MVETNAEATIDSTLTDDTIAEVNTDLAADNLLADIVRNSEFVESLPNEQVPELDPEESDDQDPIQSDEADSEDVEGVQEEANNEEDEDAAEAATDISESFAAEDLDLEAKVIVKIDGEDSEVSFGDLIKGYSTEQHLSKKGRELGDARKQMDVDYDTKVKELGNMSKASAAVLYSNEQQLSKEYHEIETQIEQARKDGDTYEVNELKDKREQAQKSYWQSRNQRESLVKQVTQQEQEAQQKDWQAQLANFNERIPELIPDFNDKTATSIREFAIAEGIPAEVLDSIADPVIVKFVDDYRRLKQGVTKGAVKRKSAPTKKIPVRKAKSVTKRKQDANEAQRQKVLSGQGSDDDQQGFLRGLAERSLNL